MLDDPLLPRFAAGLSRVGRYYGNANLGLLIGGTLGVIGGLYNVVRVALRLSKEGRPSDRSAESQTER